MLLYTPDIYESYIMYMMNKLSDSTFRAIITRTMPPRLLYSRIELDIVSQDVLNMLLPEFKNRKGNQETRLYRKQLDDVMLESKSCILCGSAASINKAYIYDYGQYYPCLTHLFAMYCTGIHQYVYITYNKDTYTDTYTWDDEGSLMLLRSRIHDLSQFLQQCNLWELYEENWQIDPE